MNKLIVILSICCFPFIMLAQEEVPIEEALTGSLATEGKIARHEFGLNLTDFFERLISFNDLMIEDPNAYLLTYKYLLNHKRAIRIGLNGTYDTVDSQNSGFGNESDKVSSYDFDVRVGYFMNRRINNRWSAYLGIDAIYGYAHSEETLLSFSSSNIGILATDISTFGGGPAIGFQFFINSKISLSTELTIYYKNTESQISIDEGGSSLPDSVSTTKFSSANIASPASLYFNFRF